MTAALAFLDSTFGGFQNDVRRQVRRETYDWNIGQTGWLDLAELRRFAARLDCRPGRTVLDVGCGSGGPTLQLVRDTGVAVVGVDSHADAIATASSAARRSALEARARFEQLDASQRLPFPDASFDAIFCVDAIHHFVDRGTILADWRRLLKPGGLALYTDPVVLTGIVSQEELAERGSIGFFKFSPPGANKRLLTAAGLELVQFEDLTGSVERIAERWHAARERHAEALAKDEGRDVFEALQQYLRTATKLAREARISRHLFVARRPA